jgi:hypothetical protein
MIESKTPIVANSAKLIESAFSFGTLADTKSRILSASRLAFRFDFGFGPAARFVISFRDGPVSEGTIVSL